MAILPLLLVFTLGAYQANAAGWLLFQVDSSTVPQCPCPQPQFCKVVFVSAKRVAEAQNADGRITLQEGEITMDVSFQSSPTVAGLYGTAVNGSSQHYTVVPCPKNTDNERQFHLFTSQQLMLETPDEGAESELGVCCDPKSIDCKKVIINRIQFDQACPEPVFLDTGREGSFAEKYYFQQQRQLSKNTKEKMYTNHKQQLTLHKQGDERSVQLTMPLQGSIRTVKSLTRCLTGDYFWQTFVHLASQQDIPRASPEASPDEFPLIATNLLEQRAVSSCTSLDYGTVMYCEVNQAELTSDTPAEGFEITDLQYTTAAPTGTTEAPDNGKTACEHACRDSATGCTHFTWTNFRGEPRCFLLTSCKENKADQCLSADPQTCLSGPSTCDGGGSYINCPAIQDHGAEYIDWQCHDYFGAAVDGYAGEVAPGVTCVLSCDSWRALGSTLDQPIEGHLKSTCQSDGTWSATEPYWGGSDGQGTTLQYPKPHERTGLYPTPTDATGLSLKCHCETLQLTWPFGGTDFYDPNTEAGTDFLCNEDRTDPKHVEHGNTCAFFCDNYLTAVVRCWDGQWTGEPELGFWCKTEPGTSTGPALLPTSSTSKGPPFQCPEKRPNFGSVCDENKQRGECEYGWQ